MFVKLYRYRIKKKDFSKWKEIQKAADKLYKKHGYGGKSFSLTKENAGFLTIIDVGFYKSKNEFLRIEKNVDNDRLLDSLWKKFLQILHNRRYYQEEFESVEF